MTVCSTDGRVRLVSAALLGMVLLAGCETDGTNVARHLKPLSPEMVSELEKKNMPKESPMVVRIYKEESELEVWKADVTGHFALLKTYPICRWSGELGPKVREGDRQAPEGFYTITPSQMNPNSHYYLSFDIGYPNAFDRAYGRTGSQLMVHGDCSSRGCYAMTDEQISEIYALARESFFGGQRSFQVQAYPFHMTALNMARHANNPNIPFWNMLKDGSDHFEVTRLEPKVDVCEKRYVFDAQAPASGPPLTFNPAGRCPAYEVPAEISDEVAEKSRRDQAETAGLVSHGIAMAPVRTGTDGGMNKVFLARLRPPTGPDGSDRFVSIPGTIPANVNPPTPPDPAIEAAANPPPPPIKTAQAAAPSSPPAGGGNGIAGLFGLASAETRSVPPAPSAAPSRPQTTTANRPDDTNPITRFLASDSGNPASHSSPTSASTESSSSSSDSGLGRVTNSVSRLLGLGSEDKKPAPPTPPKPPHVAAVPPPPPSRPPALNVPTPPAVATPPSGHANPVASTVPAPARPEPVRQPANQNDPSSASSPQPVTSANAATNTLNGAQPVLPTGSFDNRWGAIR